MKLVVRLVSDTVIIVTQYSNYAFELCILQSAFLSQSTFYPGLQPIVCFRLTIFRLISSKVQVKSEHLFTLLNYIGHQRVFDCTESLPWSFHKIATE